MPDAHDPGSTPSPAPAPKKKQGTVTQWIEGARNGSMADRHKIWERMLPDFLRMARFVIANDRMVVRTTPDDLVNEMYIRADAAAWEQTLQNSTHLRRRMAAALRCLVADLARRTKNEGKALRAHSELHPDAVGLDPTEMLSLEEFMKRLEKLGEPRWRLFTRHVLDDIPLREIARIDGVPESSLRIEFQRLIEFLRGLARGVSPPVPKVSKLGKRRGRNDAGGAPS